ncbi:hypothetical protein LJR232_002569 [Aquipseudomonas alcaligenes]
MKVERSVQKALLERLNDANPNAVGSSELMDLIDDMKQLTACCLYLHEHGLVRATITDYLSGGSELASVKITARGTDFIRKDGGLSAILGVVTINFHEEVIRHLVEDRILQAGLPEIEKHGVLEALKRAPGDSIKHLTTRLLDAGLENLPRAIQLVQTCIRDTPA